MLRRVNFILRDDISDYNITGISLDLSQQMAEKCGGGRLLVVDFFFLAQPRGK